MDDNFVDAPAMHKIETKNVSVYRSDYFKHYYFNELQVWTFSGGVSQREEVIEAGHTFLRETHTIDCTY
jgi:hypothetical protein